MALTWTDLKTKFVRQSRDTTPGTLIQGAQDMNTAQHMFNARLSRYFSRKQQFADIVQGQSIYQSPIDSIRVSGITIQVGTGSGAYKIPLKEIRNEYEWRQLVSYPYSSNWPAYYKVMGNDEIDLWPTPSQSVANGMRFYYQQADQDLSFDDLTSANTANTTVSVTNGSTLVTASSAIFAPNMKGFMFQITGANDFYWYEIVDVPTTTTLTLKSAFIGLTNSARTFRVGEVPIIPQEYHNSLVDYALSLYYSSKGNEARATQHMNNYEQAVLMAIQEYSSSNESSVITDDDMYANAWSITPMPGM